MGDLLLNGESSKEDSVRNPSHYQLFDGVESIEVIRKVLTKEEFRGFCFGNVLKYRARAGKKDKLEQDIAKAGFYNELWSIYKDE